MSFTTRFSNKTNEKADTIVIGMYEGGKLSPAAKDIDKQVKGIIAKNLKGHQKFTGKIGQSLSLALSIGFAVRVIVIGLGEAKEMTALQCETIGGALFDALKTSSASKIDIMLTGSKENKTTNAAEMAAHLAIGVKLK